MAALVTAYRKRDGAKVQIPEDWLDHPRLGSPFQRTKPTPAQQQKAAEDPTPSTVTAQRRSGQKQQED